MLETEIVTPTEETAAMPRKRTQHIPTPVTTHTRFSDGTYLLQSNDPAIETLLIREGFKVPQKVYRVDRAFMERIGVLQNGKAEE